MFKRTWIDETVTVETSAAELASLLQDADAWPTWTKGLQAIKRRDRSPFGVGTKFTMVLDPGLPIGCKMYVYEPTRLEWGGGLGPWIVRHSFEITPIDDKRCQLRHAEYATGLLALLALPLERGIYRYDHRWTKTIVARFASA